MGYLANLFGFEWVQTRSPAGAIQWQPKNAEQVKIVADAHVAGQRHAPIMFTTDLALRQDPAYAKIAKHFLDDPKAFELAYAKAWFKLTHRDLGPRARYLGPDAPKEALVWQDPIPPVDHVLVTAGDIATLKLRILASGVSGPALVRTAWAAASSFRGTDMRGGANGGRLRLAPQKDWAVNDPAELQQVLTALQKVQDGFNQAQAGGRKRVSLADLIVLAGGAAIEQAASQAGHPVKVPFAPGRMDASQDMTDTASFAVLEPKADGFRNYHSADARLSPVEALVDKAALLRLSVPEMTALVGGLRVLDANSGHNPAGVLTAHPGRLSNDYFVNLLDLSTTWSKSDKDAGLYVGRDQSSGQPRWTATPVDLVFGSNSELRAVAEVYASADGQARFLQDFVKAWTKVMNLDRFDLRH